MSYFGGKLQDGVYQTIINQIPRHLIYIEAFMGGGAIMQKKKPAIKNIGIDPDAKALSMFPKTDHVDLMNTSFFDFSSCSAGKNAYLVPKNQSSGRFTSSGSGRRFRIGRKTYKRSEVFIYCDPPYPHSTRKCDKRYNYELSDAEHLELLTRLKKLDCNIAISTYPNEIYERELSDWRLIKFESMTRGGWKATEYLYMNYPEPVFLHDDQYLGIDANNRQDINRRIQRTKKRILNWDPRERIKFLKNFVADLPEDEKKLILDA